MNKRNFIKTSVGASVAGALSSGVITDMSAAAYMTAQQPDEDIVPVVLKNTDYSTAKLSTTLAVRLTTATATHGSSKARTGLRFMLSSV
jgi:hypothetical protein